MMNANSSMTSTRPYLIRAFYEWIIDNNLTPYILINAECKDVLVPSQYVSDGKIVFNIAPGVVQTLNISNELIEFDARFSGTLKHIYAPIEAVLAIYARENGRGMVFDEAKTDNENDAASPQPSALSENPQRRGRGKPNLKIVK